MSGEPILVSVINWNGCRDTVACAESMRRIAGPPFHLLLCDNGSSDDSFEHLCAWVRDALDPLGESRTGIGPDGHVVSFELPGTQAPASIETVHVMRLTRNFGYSGAINRCIDWGRAALAPGYYWLLNNDVLVEPDALMHLVGAARSRPDVGPCGSVLLDWEEPHAVQAIGGLFHRVLAVGVHLRALPAGSSPDGDLFYGVDYPVGASLLVTREFIDSVGLMDEGYFLYYEEIDWAERARARGFRPAVALRSRLRHKVGASTGSTGGARRTSMLSEYYGVVNRLRITRKFSPWLLPVVWLSLFLVVIDRAVHREWVRAGLVLRLMLRPGSIARP